jgi:hypothetical protein
MEVIEETRITVRGSKVKSTVRLTPVPIGAHAVFQPGEEPIVVVIDPSCLEFAELWFTRAYQMAPLIRSNYEEKSWLCLLNGCLVSELKARKATLPRYETRPLSNPFSDRDGKWTVVDTHMMNKWTVPHGPFAVAVHVDTEHMALKVANALNDSEGYPKASKYVKPQAKKTRRKNG